jgi:hypothetical protein
MYGQESQPTLNMLPFTVQGIGAEEGQIIQDLIRSYIQDLGNMAVRNVSQDTGDGSADYVLSGSLSLNGDSRVLALEISNTATGEHTRVTSTHKSASELVLKSRSLVEEALLNNTKPGTGEASGRITEEQVIGRWRGDRGIAMVRLRRGGLGVAVFASGAQMELAYSINGNTLQIVQTSANADKFYYPFPPGVATQLADLAEPMRWEFNLTEGGHYLRGKKIGTNVEYEGERIINLYFGNEWNSAWIKVSR